MIELCQKSSECKGCHEHGGSGCESSESSWFRGIHELDLIEVWPCLVFFLFPGCVVLDFVSRVQSVSSKLEFVSFNIKRSLGWTQDRNIAQVLILGWINYDPTASIILDLFNNAFFLANLGKAGVANGIVSSAGIDELTSESTEKSIAYIQSWFYSLLIGFWKILVKDSGWSKDSISSLTR